MGGTLRWSHAGNGSGVVASHIAVPNYDGVADVFLELQDGSIQAVTADGTVGWAVTPPTPLTARRGVSPDFKGGLVVQTYDSVVDAAGTVGETASLPLVHAATALEYGFWQGVSTATGALVEVAGPAPVEALFAFQTGVGNRERNNAVTDLRQGIYAKAHAFRDYEDAKLRHTSLLIIPRNQAYWRATEPEVFKHAVPGAPELFFGTLGAGPVPGGNASCGAAVLNADFNRQEDTGSRRPPFAPSGSDTPWMQKTYGFWN